MASIGVASWIDPLKAAAAFTEPGPVNYQEKLGVEPINAAGAYTALSAAVMPPSVQAALPRQPNTRCVSNICNWRRGNYRREAELRKRAGLSLDKITGKHSR